MGRLKLILTRGGVPGHILACDMLICPTDTRSKNMHTRQPPYIQFEIVPGSGHKMRTKSKKDPKLIGSEGINTELHKISPKIKSEA